MKQINQIKALQKFTVTIHATNSYNNWNQIISMGSRYEYWIVNNKIKTMFTIIVNINNNNFNNEYF